MPRLFDRAGKRSAMQRRVMSVMFWCVYSVLCTLQEARATEAGLFQKSVEEMKNSSLLFLIEKDVELKLSGRVRQETFGFYSPLLLRSDYFDRYTFQRARFNFDMDAVFGKQAYGAEAVGARIRLTSFKVYDNNKAYSPPVLEPVAFDSNNYVRKVDISEHTHESIVPLAFLEEGFVAIKLEKFIPLLVPTEFKVGYFPQLIGRGVALGDYFGGGIDYLGWSEEGNLGNNTNLSPGLTLTLGDKNSLALEFYYSQWKKQSQGPDHTRKEIAIRRLDRDELIGNPRSIERGVHGDRDLFSVRGIAKYRQEDGFSCYFEPYLVYVDAPELKVEFDGDSSAKLGTAGCMVDWEYNGWRVNGEFGLQFGHQVMHPIDRNHLTYDGAYYTQAATLYADEGVPQSGSVVAGRLDAKSGVQAKYHSHILLGMTTGTTLDSAQFLPYRAYYVSDENAHVNAGRMVSEQGGFVRRGPPEQPNEVDSEHFAGEIYQSSKFTSAATTHASLYSPYQVVTGIDYYDNLFRFAGLGPNGSLFNANIPFGAGARFRKKYTLEFAGLMGLLDVSYTAPSKKWTLAAAVGYISGAEYPFDTEEDKRYTGFIPLRDANYQGHIVKSYAVLAARRIARPSTYSNLLLYAPNNYEDSSNLQYFGFGSAFRPCEERNKLLIESNLLYFWQDVAPYVWDKTATRDFGDPSINGIWQKFQSDAHFTGYQTTRRASKQLGLELNTVVTWTPVSSVEIRALFATYIPGKLYEDIEGTPNQYGVRFDANGDLHLDSLGRKVPFGGMLRLTYLF